MKDVILIDCKRWNWKSQVVGEDKEQVSEMINDIERGFYKTKEVKIDLQVYNLSQDFFECTNLFEFLVHMELVNKAQIKYPVIVNREGRVIDGRHRICKAIMKGHKSIKGIMILDSKVV